MFRKKTDLKKPNLSKLTKDQLIDIALKLYEQVDISQQLERAASEKIYLLKNTIVSMQIDRYDRGMRQDADKKRTI